MKPTSEQRNGVIGTVVAHLLLLALLFILALKTPLPRPGEEGVEIRMGDSYEGTFAENIEPSPAQRTPPPTPPPQETQPEEVVTQTDEESVALERRREQQQTPPREEPVVQQPVEPQPEPEPEPEPEPVVDPRALYTGSSSHGNSSSGTGDSGNLGRPDGTSQTGGAIGGGEGTGRGSGIGEGLGGDGTGYYLQGRGKVNLVKPEYTSNEQGRVVVEVLVDRAGNVVQARAGVRIPNTDPVIGSTISDQKLWEQAEKAALRSKFSKDEKAVERQKGYIVYNFIKLSD